LGDWALGVCAFSRRDARETWEERILRRPEVKVASPERRSDWVFLIKSALIAILSVLRCLRGGEYGMSSPSASSTTTKFAPERDFIRLGVAYDKANSEEGRDLVGGWDGYLLHSSKSILNLTCFSAPSSLPSIEIRLDSPVVSAGGTMTRTDVGLPP
jgi:hypothetical protein